MYIYICIYIYMCIHIYIYIYIHNQVHLCCARPVRIGFQGSPIMVCSMRLGETSIEI